MLRAFAELPITGWAGLSVEAQAIEFSDFSEFSTHTSLVIVPQITADDTITMRLSFGHPVATSRDYVNPAPVGNLTTSSATVDAVSQFLAASLQLNFAEYADGLRGDARIELIGFDDRRISLVVHNVRRRSADTLILFGDIVEDVLSEWR